MDDWDALREPQRQRPVPVERPVGLGVQLRAVEDDEPGVDAAPPERLNVRPRDPGHVDRAVGHAQGASHSSWSK